MFIKREEFEALKKEVSLLKDSINELDSRYSMRYCPVCEKKTFTIVNKRFPRADYCMEKTEEWFTCCICGKDYKKVKSVKEEYRILN